VDYADLDVLYTYDAVSNRETEVETAPDGSVVKNRTSTYNTRDQLTTLTDNLNATQSVTYGFDASGNQISRTQAGATQFVFDFQRHASMSSFWRDKMSPDWLVKISGADCYPV